MKRTDGFTLVEVAVGVAVFLLFALGIYGALTFVFKVVYQSRVNILETALLSEELEIVRNLPFASVGTINGVPSGVLLGFKTVVRNNVTFNVTTTVRNIDDSFDGTLGGAPNDTAPADYKLVEMSAQCLSCGQKTPLTLSTRVSPKNLEGATQNGALFIHVFDSLGLPVEAANVHIVNTAATPNTVIDDVTDTSGYLRIIDAPTGTMSYRISVSKNGYSADFTTSSSATVPNPVKPPANVVSQAVTNVSFSIDRVSSLAVSTLDVSCGALGSRSFTLYGEKPIGTDPIVYKYSESMVSDGAGLKEIANLEADNYMVSVSGTSYDLAGSVPMFPLTLSPTMNQAVTLLLKPHTTHSLLVKVKDAGTGLPLSDAEVNLTKTGYDETLITGLGYVRQTDWSGGSGQEAFTGEQEYWSDNGGVHVATAGDIRLKKVGNDYLSSGWLESSTFDLGTEVDLKNVVIDPINQSAQTGVESVLVQVAASNSSTPASWDFIGPDGTSATFFTATNTLIHANLAGNRYMRYRLYLSTADVDFTPTVSELAFTFINGCNPPGQSFFSGLSNTSYTLTVTREGYTATSGEIDVSGGSVTTVSMSPL